MKLGNKILLSSLALFAFAFNSILCRLALSNGHIDPLSFSILRLVGGAAILWLLVRQTNKTGVAKGSWLAGISLFLYVVTFSIAYTSLSAATGALILFGTVQLTMFVYAYFKGERLTKLNMIGLLLAITGFTLLIMPSTSQPNIFGSAFMTLSGIAWAIYTIQGKKSPEPIATSADNFGRTLIPIFCLTIFWHSFQADIFGITLALLSGVITSGIGYAIWYKVLPTLQTITASTIQLSVPLITELLSFGILNEQLSDQFLLVSILILLGFALVTYKSTAS